MGFVKQSDIVTTVLVQIMEGSEAVRYFLGTGSEARLLRHGIKLELVRPLFKIPSNFVDAGIEGGNRVPSCKAGYFIEGRHSPQHILEPIFVGLLVRDVANG